jgi:hypothetical protein
MEFLRKESGGKAKGFHHCQSQQQHLSISEEICFLRNRHIQQQQQQ